MKTNEYLRKVRDMGYGLVLESDYISVTAYGMNVVLIDREIEYSIEIVNNHKWGKLDNFEKLYNLSMEYASTSIADREDAIKYVWTLTDERYVGGSQLWNIDEGYWTLGYYNPTDPDVEFEITEEVFNDLVPIEMRELFTKEEVI